MMKILCAVIGVLTGSTVLSVSAAEESPVVSFIIPAGRPDAAECRKLVKTINDVGFDQCLIYPSTGLDYEYLGEDFFGMVGTFLDEAKRRGMHAWLYDEFNWPSGTARGRVPAENEKCLYRELVAHTNAAGEFAWDILVSRGINVDNYCLDTNNLEPESARRFMELTHHAYARYFGKYMGTLIRGIFTDEPGHCSSRWRLKMPSGTVLRLPYWSGMEEEYRLASGGRDFRTDAVAAFKAGTKAESEVFRLWTDLRSRRYRKTFFDPIGAWCAQQGIVSTGHLVSEDWPLSCAYVNGSPLHTLKGLRKPGIDLIKSNTDYDFELLTLAFGQSAALANDTTGAVELFALGPCDLTFTFMRKLYWICALHKIDTYFQSLYHHRAYRFDMKDSWAMFTSPTQPWFKEMPLLHATAKEAARWAKKPFVCDIAVVYPQRAAGASMLTDWSAFPDLSGLCRDLTCNQFTYRLIEEDEATTLPVVLEWKGRTLVERRSGATFKDNAAAVAWLEAKFASRPRVKDATGKTRPGFVTRAYADGSAVAVDATSGEVLVAADGKLAPRSAERVVRDLVRKNEPVSLSLSGPSRRRMWFWTTKADAQRESDGWLKRADKVEAAPRYPKDNMLKLTVTEPLANIRFALRRYPADKKFAVTLDGKPLAFPKPCTGVAYAFNELYAETESMTLAAGEHVFELTGGKDGKLFLPVMWMVGDFSEPREGVFAPRVDTVPLGSLAATGYPSFAGTATYRLNVTLKPGERLAVDTGGAVVRARLGGRDLGVRGWAPFAWDVPADLVGKELPLEIDVITSVRPIFGDERSPDAKLDHALWVAPSLDNPSKVGLRRVFTVGSDPGVSYLKSKRTPVEPH